MWSGDLQVQQSHMWKFWLRGLGLGACTYAWHGKCYIENTSPVLKMQDSDDTLMLEEDLEEHHFTATAAIFKISNEGIQWR
jgi:hypothetical protein